MEQKYFDCIYFFNCDGFGRVRLFDRAYKEMLDNVVIDGKPYSPEHVVSGFSDGDHSVRLVFKEGIEPTSLSGFFAETDIVKVRETNIDFSKVTDMSEIFSESSSFVNFDGSRNWDEYLSGMFSECSSRVNLDSFRNCDVPNVKSFAGMFSDFPKLCPDAEFIKEGDGIPDEVFKKYEKIKRQIKTRGVYNDILKAEHQAQGKGLKK